MTEMTYEMMEQIVEDANKNFDKIAEAFEWVRHDIANLHRHVVEIEKYIGLNIEDI